MQQKQKNNFLIKFYTLSFAMVFVLVGLFFVAARSSYAASPCSQDYKTLCEDNFSSGTCAPIVQEINSYCQASSHPTLNSSQRTIVDCSSADMCNWLVSNGYGNPNYTGATQTSNYSSFSSCVDNEGQANCCKNYADYSNLSQCQPPTVTASAGQPCGSGINCASGLSCTFLSSSPTGFICTAQAASGGLGATCNLNTPCNSSLYCDFSSSGTSGNGQCISGGGVGLPCNDITGIYCKSGLTCANEDSNGNGLCVTPGGSGTGGAGGTGSGSGASGGSGGTGGGGTSGSANPNCPTGTSDPTHSGVCLPDNAPKGGIAGAGTLAGLILMVITILLTFAGLVAVVMIVIGGFQYITAAGNEENAEKGKKVLVNAIIGLVVVLLAYAIVKIITATLTTDQSNILKTTYLVIKILA